MSFSLVLVDFWWWSNWDSEHQRTKDISPFLFFDFRSPFSSPVSYQQFFVSLCRFTSSNLIILKRDNRIVRHTLTLHAFIKGTTTIVCCKVRRTTSTQRRLVDRGRAKDFNYFWQQCIGTSSFACFHKRTTLMMIEMFSFRKKALDSIDDFF